MKHFNHIQSNGGQSNLKAGHVFPFLLLLTLLNGCISPKELTNFTEGSDFSALTDSIRNSVPLRLQTDDLLSIVVYNSNETDPKAIAPFNLVASAPSGGENNDPTAANYRVDENGNINFPVLGPIRVAGLTLSDTRDTLNRKLKTYLKDPIVNLRLLNFRITVLGEVARPGAYTVPNERVNVLDAIGMAGDLGNYGRRDNILVIREQNGKRQFGHLNLKSRDIFTSPYFYLQQNDIVYVEPLEQKTTTIGSKGQQILPWITSGVTFLNLIIILTRP